METFFYVRVGTTFDQSSPRGFGAEKVLKEIFGNRIGPQEVELYNLVERSPAQKKVLEKQLVGEDLVRGGGVAQYGGFLSMLASLGVPLAISLVKNLFGKGMQTKPPPPRQRRTPRPPPRRGKGMQMQRPPPFFGSWRDLKKNNLRFKDVPLSNIDRIYVFQSKVYSLAMKQNLSITHHV